MRRGIEELPPAGPDDLVLVEWVGPFDAKRAGVGLLRAGTRLRIPARELNGWYRRIPDDESTA